LGNLLAIGEDDAIVMFGVLEIIFGQHVVTGRQRIAGERKVFVRDRLRRARDFTVGTVAVVGARQRVLQLPVVLLVVTTRVAAAAVTGVVTASAATAAMLLSLPHGPRISLLPFVKIGLVFLAAHVPGSPDVLDMPSVLTRRL